MASSTSGRRTYGSGSIFVHAGAFYGKWRVGDRQIKRKLGPVRVPGGHEGLTRKQAESRLRELMAETLAPRRDQQLTFEAAGALYLGHLEDVMQVLRCREALTGSAHQVKGHDRRGPRHQETTR